MFTISVNIKLTNNPDILKTIHDKQTLILYSTSMAYGSSYLHTPMIVQCVIALNMDLCYN